ncbi:MAG: GntR family transcriptional regulator [Oscillospiraceae bacterium]|nr:GntR family transcriptional regulator [Oscillospiraceae bacterium]
MKIHNKIDKSGHIPVYYQIAESIKRYIQENSIKPGGMILSERELCDVFNVSRMTVRQAVNLLTQEGILMRQKGKGTFVSALKFQRPLTSLTSFTMDMISRGFTPTSAVLECAEAEALGHVAERLQLKKGEQVIRLVRIRIANGRPHAYECSYLLYEKAKVILDMNFTNQSLYDVLEAQCGVRMSKAKEAIEASVCPDEICSKLEIPPKSLTFHIERTTYDEGGVPVEYVASHYRIDQFKFYVELNLN